MRILLNPIRNRLDRFGVLLSGLCALHCMLSIVLVSLLGLGSSLLLAPEIHRVGLGLAILVGVLTLGIGALRHGLPGPLLIGTGGIVLMTLALAAGHGLPEAMLTIAGVVLVAAAHVRNLRHAA